MSHQYTARLPKGHQWKEFDTYDSFCYGWTCEKCHAEFGLFLDEDGAITTTFDPGDETCD